MKKHVILFCIIFIFCYTGCCTFSDGKGIVVEKQHFQAYWEFVDYGTPGTPLSQEIYYPEAWYIIYEYNDCRRVKKVNIMEWRDCREGQHFYKDAPNCR